MNRQVEIFTLPWYNILGERSLKMDKLRLEKAAERDVAEIFSLYKKRVKWMDEMNINQWNKTDYLNVYPLGYYAEKQKNGELMALKSGEKTVGAVVLLNNDDRWGGFPEIPAFYVHNLVTDPGEHGVGERMLNLIEELAARNKKAAIRLDCAENNLFLNDYYDKRGYREKGKCSDNEYKGILREKNI